MAKLLIKINHNVGKFCSISIFPQKNIQYITHINSCESVSEVCGDER